MMIEVAILQVLREREQYTKLFSSINPDTLDVKTSTILKDYGEYYKTFPDHTEIQYDTFMSLFFSLLHPTMEDEKKSYYMKLLKNVLQTKVDECTKEGLGERILEMDFSTKVGNIIYKYTAGDDIDVRRSIEETLETLNIQLDKKVDIPWITTDIADLLKLEEETYGLRWRLECLRDTMRPLREGDFGIIAARPDAGKTSFLTSELTYMASQLPEGKSIVWLNNESLGTRIVTRLYQSALNAGIRELKEKQQAGTIVQEYVQAVGAIDRIKVMDIHDAWNYEIVDYLKDIDVGLLVFDMIDNVRFGGTVAGARTDQALEAMYQWARTLGVRMKCPILATSQVSADGDGMCYPLMHMLKDSKTGKQGAADFILMIGKNNDTIMENSRFISLPKNKLIRMDGIKDPRSEVLFDWRRGRFNDAQT